jgi:hypothetical protein
MGTQERIGYRNSNRCSDYPSSKEKLSNIGVILDHYCMILVQD